MTYIVTHNIFSNYFEEILVFNFDFDTHIDVMMHYVVYSEKNKRPFMLGKWKIKIKNK